MCEKSIIPIMLFAYGTLPNKLLHVYLLLCVKLEYTPCLLMLSNDYMSDLLYCMVRSLLKVIYAEATETTKPGIYRAFHSKIV
jgi:hypothetical protein